MAEKLRLSFELYRFAPSYAVLMYVYECWREITDEAWELVWEAYGSFLEDPDPVMADPASYSLWVDWFEDGQTVVRAWKGLTLSPSERGLERLLSDSGPVPWQLKVELFDSLASDQRWHPWIFDAFRRATTDVAGQIDRVTALSLLNKLALDLAINDPAPLRTALVPDAPI